MSKSKEGVMKKLGKFVPLVIILVTLGGCYASCGPVHFGSPSYTVAKKYV
jgi:hypothetical protein